jgi:murein DD-endopeptidase MepM/ murein hydrolase activator NlpD
VGLAGLGLRRAHWLVLIIFTTIFGSQILRFRPVGSSWVKKRAGEFPRSHASICAEFYESRYLGSMKMRYLFFGFFCLNIAFLSAQYPTYTSPLKGELLVTGTFGELRTNHFHGGLDFRAKTGTGVYSIADGFVSRIVVSPGGYGQAVYVDHPEGYRSVFGHLSAFSPRLTDTVKQAQMTLESFALDLRFDSLAFPVRAGDLLGKVGNRGFSFGPHLHFEIRSSVNDAPLNPLHFGMNIVDRRPPDLRKLKVYERDASGRLMRESEYDLRKLGDANYGLEKPLVVGSPYVDFGIKAYDRQQALPNNNGPYALQLYRDSVLVYGVAMDSLPYEAGPSSNAHVDYAAWTGEKSWFHRLHGLPGADLDYLETIRLAVKSLEQDQPQQVEIRVSDWAGNQANLQFSVRHEPSEEQIATPAVGTHYRLPWNAPSIIEQAEIYIRFPKKSLYEDLDFVYNSSRDSSQGVVSRVHHLHDELTPLHQSIEVRLELDQELAPDKREKTVVARCLPDGSVTSYGGGIDASGKPLLVSVSSFGAYCLMVDTLAPKIIPIDFRNPLGQSRRIAFEISDNFATSGAARGLRYRATLNGKYIPMEYDLKKQLIYYELARPLAAPGAQFELRVTDDRGNVAGVSQFLLP